MVTCLQRIKYRIFAQIGLYHCALRLRSVALWCMIAVHIAARVAIWRPHGYDKETVLYIGRLRRIFTEAEIVAAASYVLISPLVLRILIRYPHIRYQTEGAQLGEVERTKPVPFCTAGGVRRILCITVAVVLRIPVCCEVCRTVLVRRSLQPVVCKGTPVLIVYLWFAILSYYSVIIIRRTLFLCEPRLQLVHVSVLQYLVVIHVTGDTLPLDVSSVIGLHLVHAAALLVGACAAVCYKADSVDLERSMLELWCRPAGDELSVLIWRSIGNVARRVFVAAVTMCRALIKEELSLLHRLAVALCSFCALSYRTVCRRIGLSVAVG